MLHKGTFDRWKIVILLSVRQMQNSNLGNQPDNTIDTHFPLGKGKKKGKKKIGENKTYLRKVEVIYCQNTFLFNPYAREKEFLMRVNSRKSYERHGYIQIWKMVSAMQLVRLLKQEGRVCFAKIACSFLVGLYLDCILTKISCENYHILFHAQICVKKMYKMGICCRKHLFIHLITAFNNHKKRFTQI